MAPAGGDGAELDQRIAVLVTKLDPAGIITSAPSVAHGGTTGEACAAALAVTVAARQLQVGLDTYDDDAPLGPCVVLDGAPVPAQRGQVLAHAII